MKLRALAVDDEAAAIDRLRQLCAQCDDIAVVAEAHSAIEALQCLQHNDVDLMFLDVDLGASTGIQLLELLNGQRLPLVIFVTAFEQYARAAFEFAAVDYLLKPCGPEQFARAVARARERLRPTAPRQELESVHAALQQLIDPPTPHPTSARDGLFIEDQGRFVHLQTDAIDYVESARNYVVIHAAGRQFCHRTSITQLERQLGSSAFLRIHKSTLVNVKRVEYIEPDFRGAYVFKLRCGAQCRSGQTYRGVVQALLRSRV